MKLRQSTEMGGWYIPSNISFSVSLLFWNSDRRANQFKGEPVGKCLERQDPDPDLSMSHALWNRGLAGHEMRQPAVKISKHIASFSDSLFCLLNVRLRGIFSSPEVSDLLKSLDKRSVESLEFHASSKAEMLLAWQFQGRCYQWVAWTMEKPPSGLF